MTFSRIWKTLRWIPEWIMVGMIRLCGISAIIFVFSIFYFVFREAWPFIRDNIDLGKFFLSEEWYPTSVANKRYGILGMVAGTVSVMLIAMSIAVPVSLAAAVYISQFCNRKLREILKIMIEFLAAIPSVVWGFTGLVIMNPLIIKLTGAPIGLNALNAGIIVGLMSVPIIVSLSEDAIRAVPDSYIEAGEALGATRWELICKVIFPAAKNGLLAAVLLGVGRAVGETMATLMATGHAINIPFDSTSPFFHPMESVRTLTASIASELGEAPRLNANPDGKYPVDAHHYQSLFVIGLVLFAIAFCINLLADLMVRGVRRRS